ncbi:uncharacterized protein LOC143114318 isoform X1 [Alosa pseudoharengus]|uniref:uncharacterized protein LOC143114318 isoform X1 n=1 Tax=Alosa pseudoharengus TaxID=34774 RepID=UPI003F8BE7D2
MEQNVADLLTDAFSDVKIDFEHLNFKDYAEQSSLAGRARETEKRDNTQEPTGARRQSSLQSSEENHNMHKNSTGKETYAQDTASEIEVELSHLEDIEMADRKKYMYDSCDIWQDDEDETRHWTERPFPFGGDQTGVDQSNAGGSDRCGNVQNEEGEDGVPFLQLCNPQSVDDTCSYSDSNSGSEDAEATKQLLSVDREAMNERSLCASKNTAGLTILSSLMPTAQGAQAEGGDLREFSEEDQACVGEDFAEYPTELTNNDDDNDDDDDDDDVEGDDEEEEDDNEDERKVKSDAKAPVSRIGADNTQEGEYIGEEEEDDDEGEEQEQEQEEEEKVAVEVVVDDDIVEHGPMHAKPHDSTNTYSSDERVRERQPTTTYQTMSKDDSGPQNEDESESPSMHRHNDKLSQIQDVFTNEDATIQRGRAKKEIIAQGIEEEERHGEGQNVVKQDTGVDELPFDSENEFPVYSHDVDTWGGWREELNRYMPNTELNLDVNIGELDAQDPDINIPNTRDCVDTITPERAWPSETLWDETSQQQPLRNPSATLRQEFVVVEDVTSDHDFFFHTSLEQDSHVTDWSLGGCLLDEDTTQESMEDNTSDTFGEEERSWDQERERIEAFNRFYNDSEESSIEGIGERTHKVHFCLEPQIAEVLDSESEFSDIEADEDSEEDSDTEDINDEEQSDTEEPQDNAFPCHDREEPSENEFPPQDQEEPSENEFLPQDQEEPSGNEFPPQDQKEPSENVFPPQDQEEQTENAFPPKDQDVKFEEVQPISDNPTIGQLVKKVITDQPMEKQLTDQPVEEEGITLQTSDKQIVTLCPTTSKRQKCLRILKSTLRMCAIIGTGLLTFWWATDHLDWTMW